MKTFDVLETFSAEVSPKMVLLDVQGRKNPVLTPDRAIEAIELANSLQDIGGTGRWTSYSDLQAHPADGVTLLFYRSHSGRPNKSEIARAARAISRSEIRLRADHDLADDLFVTGSRAVVYAETVSHDRDTAVFIVSNQVWYNHNRSVTGWPLKDEHVSLFLDDINGRLTEGSVSIAR